MLKKIVERAIAGEGCTPQEATNLLHLDLSILQEGATRIREAHFQNQIELCAIINAKSGACDMDCAFCSQSSCATTEIKAYPLLPSEKLEEQMAEILAWPACRCSLVTSGGKLSPKELNQVCTAAKKYENAPLCASLGRLSHKELIQLKEAGIRRFHHNLETSENYYPSICSTQDWNERLETVRAAQKAGMSICSGGLFGLGESWDDRIQLALTLRKLKVDSLPINFLFAHPGTPLREQSPLSADDALRIIALYRFLLPTVILRICGGRLHVLGDRQDELFASGANGLMTGNYLTVSGSQYEADLAMLNRLGLAVAPQSTSATK